MKTEQEQIEEIAKDIIYSIEDCHGNHCATCYMRERCTVKYHARKVYNAGYRKASDVIDEFVDKIFEKIRYEYENYPNAMTVGTYYQLRKEINELADEMRKEAEK